MDNLLRFRYGSVPVEVAAQMFDRNENWIRAGIIAGWLPIGIATRKLEIITDVSQIQKGERVSIYISPKKLYEFGGYIWEGNDV